MDANSLLIGIAKQIVNPLIYLLFAVALLVFLWGGFKFVMHADDETKREEGKQSLIWGIAGMLIMLLALFIIQVIANTIGAPVPSL